MKKVDGIVTGGIDVPEGCEVEQIHMVWLTSLLHLSRTNEF